MDQVTISDEDRRVLGGWAADRAASALPLFEAHAPHDLRPREAIAGIRRYTEDGRRTAELRALAWAAQAAAGAVADPAAAAAARSACCAAATPYVHPLASPHQSRHVLAPAVYQARATELAAGEDTAVGDAELLRAIETAPPAVRALLRRMPARSPGRGRLDTLYHRLDAALRADAE
ncbi:MULTISPECIES: putative immunity protein [unclassified Streptomyces]|uniref:putative immunity protein n=1 Tax=unclassified Streptomyces TaxID=2593676 RepID=UPI003807F092